MPNKTVLVTGANGFIGQALVQSLCHEGYNVRATVQDERAIASFQSHPFKPQIHRVGELSQTTPWTDALMGADVVIHCAARAHVLHETEPDPLSTYRRVNRDATLHLATMAHHQGVNRFIFLSSIGVLGQSSGNTPFTDDSTPNPTSPYAVAKWEAEQAIMALNTPMDRVIIRPPLLYGPGVKGNFARLIHIARRMPLLPFGAVHNKRHFLSVANLVDFIQTVLACNTPIHDTFLIADKEAVSTTELLKTMALAMNQRQCLLPIPASHLARLFKAMGRTQWIDQLLGNLEVQANKATRRLHWKPPYTLSQQLKAFL